MSARAAGAVGNATTGTWRTPLIYRIFFPAVGLYFLYGTVEFFDGGSDLGDTTLSFALGVVLTVGPFMPVIRLQEQNVYARGLVFHRVLPLADIVDARPGYSGLSIETDDGSVFEATGVGEKWNIARWLGRRTAADSVADAILDAAAVAQHGRSPGPRPLTATSSLAVVQHRNEEGAAGKDPVVLVWINRLTQVVSTLAVGVYLIQTFRGVDLPSWVVPLVVLSVLVSAGTQLLVMRAKAAAEHPQPPA